MWSGAGHDEERGAIGLSNPGVYHLSRRELVATHARLSRGAPEAALNRRQETAVCIRASTNDPANAIGGLSYKDNL